MSNFPLHPLLPSPVGGTKLTATASTLRIRERNGSSGRRGGGGVSDVFPSPAYQITPTSLFREYLHFPLTAGIPDVSGLPTAIRIRRLRRWTTLPSSEDQRPFASSLGRPPPLPVSNQMVGKARSLLSSLIYAQAAPVPADVPRHHHRQQRHVLSQAWRDPCTGLGSPIGSAIASALPAKLPPTERPNLLQSTRNKMAFYRSPPHPLGSEDGASSFSFVRAFEIRRVASPSPSGVNSPRNGRRCRHGQNQAVHHLS